jgi:hypothetical protein
VKKNSFGLLELEMADLERFFEKNTLGLLGVNSWTFDKKGLHNGLPELQERPENGLWSFRG